MSEAGPLRIAIDSRYLSHGLIGGVQSYTRILVDALTRSDSRHEYQLWFDGKRPLDISPPDRASLHQLPWRSPVSSITNDFRIGAAMRGQGADLIHFPGNYGFSPKHVPTVITLHDAINLLPIREILKDGPRTARYAATMTYLHAVTKRAMRQRPHVVTVSNWSRDQILFHTNLPETHVTVVHGAVDDAFRSSNPVTLDAMRASLRPGRRALLADAIKNPACVLRAHRALPADLRAETTLIFFARRTPLPLVLRAASDGECVLVMQPTLDELIALYRAVDLFVFPSWYEGFGLPAAEAMSCGTPVIASDRGSLPEVVGDGGVIVDAEDHDAIAATIVRLFARDGEMEELRRRALQQAAIFTPQRMAEGMLQVYETAAFRHCVDPQPGADFAEARLASRSA